MVYRLLKNHGAGLEVTARCRLLQRRHGLGADIVFAVLVHGAAALGASAQRRRCAEVHNLAGLAIFVIAKVKLELVVLGFFVELDDHFRRERPAGFGAETVQGADFFVTQKLLDFSDFKSPTRRRFAERKSAAFRSSCDANAGVAPVVLLDDAATVGARCSERGVVAWNGVFVVTLSLVHQALGHGGNVGHEAFAAELTLLHLLQFVFPFAGQVGARQLFDAEAAQQRHELKSLGRGNQFPAFAEHVFFSDQTLDGGGTGGRCTKAFFLHRFAQFVVFNGFACTFHGTQQGRF